MPPRLNAFEEYWKRRDARQRKIDSDFSGDISETIEESYNNRFGEKPKDKTKDDIRKEPETGEEEMYTDPDSGYRMKRRRLPWDVPGGKKPTTHEEHVDFYDNAKQPETIVEIYTREMWSAEPPAAVVLMGEDRPISRVNCFYTGSPACFTKQDCFRAVKDLQKFYMEKRGLEDIPYSFLIGPDGNVYEGRGYEVRPTKVHKLYEYRNTPVDSLDIAYIGPYYKDRYTPQDEDYDPRRFWPKRSFVIPMHNAFLHMLTNAEQNEYLDDDYSCRTEVYA